MYQAAQAQIARHMETFRAIRQDFPDQFEGLCRIQDDLGEGSYLFRNRTTNVRFSLRDLGDGPVR
ncbi:MAG: hypothetical protein ACRESJ_29105 [Pseudomonas sp.]|uniref:hypothetical protein n=1 Tax=Pseudomonas sp. TaxID=306 RepID=UPI003D6F7AF9